MNVIVYGSLNKTNLYEEMAQQGRGPIAAAVWWAPPLQECTRGVALPKSWIISLSFQANDCTVFMFGVYYNLYYSMCIW